MGRVIFAHAFVSHHISSSLTQKTHSQSIFQSQMQIHHNLKRWQPVTILMIMEIAVVFVQPFKSGDRSCLSSLSTLRLIGNDFEKPHLFCLLCKRSILKLHIILYNYLFFFFSFTPLGQVLFLFFIFCFVQFLFCLM